MGESNSVTFFCRPCNLERDYDAVKRFLSFNWGPNEVPYWQARCKCKRILWRHIEDKHKDPYVYYSPSLRKYRAENWRDLVQPGDKSFKTLYTKTANEMEEAQEKAELKEKAEIKNRDRALKELKKNVYVDSALKKTVERIYE